MSGDRPTVYLVDDDESVRKSLDRLLSSADYRVECCESAEAFLDRHDAALHGCVVLDLQLKEMDGFGVQQRLSSQRLTRPIVFLTGLGDIPASVRAMKAGAVDFLTKPVDATTFLSAVATALERDLDMRVEEREREEIGDRVATLTPREREVLTHVVAGRLNKQIAGDLGIAEKTIKVHRGRMMHKMGVRTVADLVRIVTLHTDLKTES